MARFTPPTRAAQQRHNFNDPGVSPAANRLMQWLGPGLRGRNVQDIGGTFTIVGVVETDDLTGEEGVDYFLGGHVYEVSGDLADRLDADLGTGFVDSNPYANGYGDPY